ncbi:FtsK/SpoIIIE domain-containing protein [Haloferula chungangensis]|uniref:FtsK/SpoIIIE domain-containing protein n=1 Tax=Haloferula chungangensis TaxID=1048331 RepID=A0ABW2L5V6_9BACT
MNDPLDPGHVLNVLGKLKTLLDATAAGELSAEEVRTAAVVAARRALREEGERAQEPMESERLALEDEYQRDLEAAKQRHADRLAWIDAKYHDARSSLTDRIARERDGKVGKVQSLVLRSQDERGREYATKQELLASVRERTAEDAVKIAELERKALKSLRSFKPLVAGKLAGKGVKVSMDDGKNLFARAEESLGHVTGSPMAKLFRFVPLSVWLVATFGVAAWLSGDPGNVMGWLPTAGMAAGGVLAIYLIALASCWGSVARLAEALQRIRLAGATAVGAMEEEVLGLKEAIQGEAEALRGELSETLITSETESQELIRLGRGKLESQLARLPEKEERLHARRLKRVEEAHLRRLAEWEEACAAEAAAREKIYQGKAAEADKVHEAALAELHRKWPEIVELRDELAGLMADAGRRFPDWSKAWLENWTPPASGEQVVPFGQMKVTMDEMVERLPQDPRFDLGEAKEFEVPLALGFPGHGSLRFDGDAREAASAINSIVLRLLATHPPGRVAFTFIDPVGLGRDYAGLMHLADYEDSIIHGRIWTQTQQIEERLADLNEHVEKVIQMYLRNEYETITEYNEQAGTIAEKYQFVVIAGFPSGMSETAVTRLRSLAASGARCGVFILIQVEPGKTIGDKGLDEELKKTCLCLTQRAGKWLLEGEGEVSLDKAPDDALATEIVHRLGRASVDSNRVEVPFSSITPDGDFWTEETGEELRVPIGRTGAKKLQYLSIGKGTRQHALIAGKTGSGKSTLFHVMITNLALYCSPEEVEFYLVDFKKGVEFKCYGTKRLPHARVVAIESDREFGLSVLHRVDDELRRRGELFRECGAQDVAGYRKATGKPLPRTLLMIDEFQEFFTEDDGTGQEASLLLDRIVRQGRAFGIHVILGSQTLGGAYTLARATLGQMVIRIALQCNEADAYLIMDDDNPAPRLLTRPGEGIYNDNAGAVASNSPFQAVWLGEEERNERLDEVIALARERGIKMPAPVVFEGNAPAELLDNELFEAALAVPAIGKPKIARAWLGAPNSIKGPTEAAFVRQSGSNLLIVGQGEDRMKAILGGTLASLSSQYPTSGLKLVVLDPEGDQGDLAELVKLLPQGGEIHVPGELDEAMAELAKRMDAGEGDDVFLVVRDLQRFKSLKPDEEFSFSFDDSGGSGESPSKIFQKLITEGPALGIHVVVSIDTWSNVGRWIPRKMLSDFQMRVLFQMSGNDSAALIDTPAAGNLGLHRALLYHEAMGSLETFRPYARVEARVLGERLSEMQR